MRDKRQMSLQHIESDILIFRDLYGRACPSGAGPPDDLPSRGHDREALTALCGAEGMYAPRQASRVVDQSAACCVRRVPPDFRLTLVTQVRYTLSERSCLCPSRLRLSKGFVQ
jgi:hypothetical protein